METVTLDFEFKKFSHEYGRFLVLCHESDTLVVDAVPFHWNYYNPACLLVGVDAPTELAIILKMTFSDNRKRRPTTAELEWKRKEVLARQEEEMKKKDEYNSYKKIINTKDYYFAKNKCDYKFEDEFLEYKKIELLYEDLKAYSNEYIIKALK